MSSVSHAELPAARAERRGWLLPVAVMATALNLRLAVASVPPLIDELRDSVPLSGVAAGALTTLPVLCMAFGAPAAPRLARRVGYELGLVVVALTLVAGILTRLVPGVGALYLGTLIAGVGIALGNVLVPALVKRDFPDRVGVMTGAYTMALSLSAAVAAGLTVPIEDAIGHGWRPALAVWALPAVLAGAIWLPLRHRGRAAAPPPTAESMNHHASRLRRSRLAWQVTLFFGFQSLSFYSLLTWLPPLLHAHGLSKGTAGAYLSAFAVIGAVSCLAAPTLGVRLPNQRALVAATIVAVVAGLTGLLVSPGSAAIVWTLLLGIGQGASVALAFLFFALRSTDDAGAAQLSSMAQSVGYSLAALGPVIVGGLHQATNGWAVPVVFLLIVQVPELLAGLGAGRDAQL